jgi:hypothetical protein
VNETNQQKFNTVEDDKNTTSRIPKGGSVLPIAEHESQNSSQGFISLAEASRQTGYHQDYLGFLCRTGKLKGFKVGRNWLVAQIELDSFIENYKNGISEVIDESGNKINVHVEKQNTDNLEEGPAPINSVYATKPLPTTNALEENVVASPLPVQAIQINLEHLKKEVIENLESRIESLAKNVGDVEKAAAQKNIELEEVKKTEEANQQKSLQAALILPNVISENQRQDLQKKFASSFVFDQKDALQSSLSQSTAGHVLNSPKVKNLFDSFKSQPAISTKMLAVVTVIAILGFAASVLGYSFFGSGMNSLPKETTIVYQGGNSNTIFTVSTSTNTSTVVVQGGTVTKNITQVIAQDTSKLFSLIDTRLNEYVSKGVFKGDKGDQGSQGLQGGATYVPSNPSSGFTGGSMLGITYLSSQDFSTNNATINNSLISNGTATFNGATNFNGITTISNLSTPNINLGFTKGSIVFEGANGLSQDNSNLVYIASTTQLSVGTSTPDASALFQLESTSKGFLAPRMTQVQRDAINNPASGLMVYNTDTNQYNVYNGSIWGSVGSGGGSGGGGVNSGITGAFGYYQSSAATISPQSTLFFKNGMVGVGTNTPSALLQVVSSSTTLPILSISSSSGSSFLTVLANGNVGIDTSTPTSVLVVNGNLDSNFGLGVATLQAGSGIVDANGGANLLVSATIGAGSVSQLALTAASSTQVAGGINQVNNPGIAGFAQGYGAYNLVNNAGGSFVNTYGAYNLSSNSNGGTITSQAFGSLNRVLNSSGTIASAFGVSSIINNTGSNSTITNATGLFVGIRNSSTGNIGTAVGLQISSPTNSGSITNNTGLLISNQSLPGVNSFNIQSLGATSRNYFAGLVSVGTTSTSTTLTLQGTAGSDLLDISSSGGSSLLRVTSAGNVGIGTTTPAQALSVVGNLRLTGALFDSNNASGTLGMVLQSTGTGQQWVATSTLGISGSATTASGTPGNIQFAGSAGTFNATSLFNWDNTNKKLSIGTTSTTSTFTLQGVAGSSPLLTISSSTGSALLTVLANGNVGIGTANPTAALTVNGDVQLSNGVYYTNPGVGLASYSLQLGYNSESPIINTGTGSGSAIKLTGGSSADSHLSLQSSAAVGTTDYINLLVGNNGGTEAMRILDNGNVGIGTTTPTQLLTVAGNLRLTGALFDSNNASGTLGMVLQSTGTGTRWVATSTLGITSASASGTPGNIQFAGAAGAFNATNLFNWDNTNFKLSVGTTSTTSTFTLQGVAGSSPVISVTSSTGASLLTVLANGNVGIGTTTPNAPLTVQGTSGNILNLTNNGVSKLTVNSGGTVTVPSSGGAFQFDTGTGFNESGFYRATGFGFSYWNGSSVQTAISYNNQGNVGIGTTTPLATLSLAASTTAAGGINFGDATANLYRSSAGTIKTDADLTVAGATGLTVTNGLTVNGLCNGCTIVLKTNNSGGGGANLIAINNNGTPVTNTNSIVNGIIQGFGFMPSSGTGEGNGFNEAMAINQTGTASGISRSLYVSPILTSLYDYRNLETASTTATLSNATPTSQLYNVLFNPITYQTASTTKYTIATSSTLTISGAPIASTTSLSLTNSIGLLIQGNNVTASTTNGVGLYVNAPTGATNNYAAIFNGGNVGIGTTTPGQKLTIIGGFRSLDNTGLGYLDFNGTTAAQLIINSALGNNAYSDMSVGGSLKQRFQVSNTTNDYIIYDGAALKTVYTILNTASTVNRGNIGFGSTTPTATMVVQGQAGNTQDILRVASSSSAVFLNVTQAGNVGIGTTNPTSLLTLSGSSPSLTITDPSLSSAPAITLNNLVNGNPTLTLGYPVAEGANRSVNFRINGNNILTVFNNGVGIGNMTGVQNTLDVSGSLAVGGYAGVNAAPSNSLIVSGSVGIGTSTPTQALSVVGNLRLTGALFDSNNASGTLGMVLQSTGTGQQWVATSTLGISGGSGVAASGTPGQLQFYGSSTNLNANASLLWDNALLRLAIGTTSTSSTLTVQGLAGAAPLLSVASSTGSSLFTVLANGNTGVGTSAPRSLFDAAGTVQLHGSASTIGLVVNSSGNVGIGTSSPNAALHVEGDSVIFGRGELGIPSAFTLRGAAANVANTSGADFTFDASNGTGNQSSGSFIFRTGLSAPISSPALDATSTATVNGGSLSWTHTVTGSNPILFVSVALNANNSSVSSVSYNGVNMTLLSSINTNDWPFVVYYMVNPPTGSHTVVVSVSAPTQITGIASSYTGVSPTNPLGTPATNARQSVSGANAITMSSTIGDTVFDAYAAQGGTITPGAGQTQRINFAGLTRLGGSSDVLATTTSTGMSWTTTGTEDAHIGVALHTSGSVTASTLAERLRIAPSGNIGIGSVTPGSLLTLQGSSGSVTDLLNIASSTGTSLFVVKSSGNVGIGTTTPGALLVVGSGTNTTAAGGINFGDATANLYRSGAGTLTTDGNINIGGSSGPTIFTNNLIRSGSGGSILSLQGNFGNNVGASVIISDAGARAPFSGSSQGLLVQTNGGGFNPSSGTGVFNNIESAFTVNQTSTANGITRGTYINPTLTSSYDYRNLETATATNTLSNANPATTQYNVLFNPITYQTASTTKYTIATSSTVTISGAPIASTTSLALTNSIGLLIQGNNVTASTTNGVGLYVNAPTGATNNYAAIFNGGNVGIGTTTPGQKLTIIGGFRSLDSTGLGYLDFNGTTAAQLIINSAIGNNAYSDMSIGGSLRQRFQVSNTTNDYVIYDGAALKTVYTILNTPSAVNRGNIGFGSTTPTATMVVQGQLGNTQDILRVASSSNAVFLNVTQAGNVGIGTTTPVQLLSVAGNMQLTGALFDSNNASGTLGMVLQTTGTGTQWVATSTLGIVSSATNYLTQNGTALFNNTGYQLGINSSTPIANLSVVGSSTAPTLPIFVVASSSGANYLNVTSAGLVNVGNFSNGVASTFNVKGGVGNASAITLYNGDDTTYYSQLYSNSNGFQVQSFRTGSSYTPIIMNGSSFIVNAGTTTHAEAARVDTNGNLGVGTTTPSARLSVTGTSAIDPFDISSTSGVSLLRVTQAGNVGIGTSTPGQQLTVVGTFRASNASGLSYLDFDAANGPTLALNASAGNNPSLNFRVGGADKAYFTTSGSGSSFTSHIYNGSVDRTVYTALNPVGSDPTQGDIGFGSTTPSASMVIQGQSGNTQDIFRVASSSNVVFLNVTQAGNIGIGTSSPVTNFAVVGNGLLTGGLNIGQGTPQSTGVIRASNGGVTPFSFTIDPVNSGFIYRDYNTNIISSLAYSGSNAGNFTLYNGGSIINRLDANGTNYITGGNFGVGTSTPVQLLSVAGNMQLTGALFDGSNASGTLGMVLQTTGTSTRWVATSTLGISGGSGVAASGTPGQLQFYGSSTNLNANANLLWDNNLLRLAIGTTSTSSTFTLQGQAGSTPLLSIASSSGSSLFTVLANGNVGIGTSSPTGGLTVYNVGKGADATIGIDSSSANLKRRSLQFLTDDKLRFILTVDNNAESSSLNGSIFGIDSYDNSGNFDNVPLAINRSTGALYMQGSKSGTQVLIGTNTQVSSELTVNNFGNTYAAVFSGGNVGIGSTTPSSPLTITSTQNGNNLYVDSNANNTWITLNNTQAGGRRFELNSGGGSSAIPSVFDLFDRTAGAARLVVNSSGDVGLGGVITTNTMTGAALSVLSTGKIGIGTTTPGQALTVAGNIQLTGALFDSTNASGTLGMVLQATGTSTRWVATSTLGISGGSGVAASGTPGQLQFYGSSTNLNANANLLWDNNLLRLAIGTTSTSSTFTLQGQGGSVPLISVTSSTGASLLTVLANGNVGIGMANPANKFDITTGGFNPTDSYFDFLNTVNNNELTLNSNFGTSNAINFAKGGSVALVINGGIYGSDDPSISSGNGKSILLNPIANKVGIGTTSPVAKLSVTGTSAIDPFDISSTSGISLLRVTQAGNVGIGTTTTSGLVTLQGGATAQNLFNITSSTGASLLNVSWYGGLTQNISSTTAVNIQDGSGNSVFAIDTTNNTGNAGLDITAGGSQTGNLLNVYSSGSTLLSGISAYGGWFQNIASTTALTIQNGSGVNIFSVNTVSGVINIATSSSTTIASILTVDGNTTIGDDGLTGTTDGRIWIRSRGTTFRFNSTGNTADYSEYFYQLSTSTPAVGTVMSVDNSTSSPVNDAGMATITRGSYDHNILGVVTNKGTGYNNPNDDRQFGGHFVNVGLLGHIAVRVSTSTPAIHIGDYLTSSAESGKATKAVRSGQVIGIALQDFDPATATTSTSSFPTVMTLVKPEFVIINNTFVLGDGDGQLATATSTQLISQTASSSLAATFLINQKGTGDLLQLQSGGQNRLLIANNGSFNLFASTTIATSTILTVTNGTTTQFSITAAGHITVGKDSAGTATIKAGDNQTAITFDVPYETIPKIVVTAQTLPNFYYGVATKTPDGFAIQISATSTQDISFDWIALAQPLNTPSQSSIQQSIVVVNQPNNPGQIISVTPPPAPDASSTPPTDSGTSTPSTDPGQVAGTSTPPSVPPVDVALPDSTPPPADSSTTP